MLGLIYSDEFLKHDVRGHPESPARLTSITSHLKETGWLDRMEPVPFGPAEWDELLWLHDEHHLEALRTSSEYGGEAFTIDTAATEDTWETARLAAGGCMTAARAAVSREGFRAVCLPRPPGHHATADRAMGFCFLDNAALCAEAALREGLERVAIVDFDVHHGNGTQDIFYHRRDVLYISLHQHWIFPGTGGLDEVGVEEGAGFTINIPMVGGARDEHYAVAMEYVVSPALKQYAPQLIIVSAGYDIHHADPLAGLHCTLKSFHAIPEALTWSAVDCCGGRMVVILEGGYGLQTLALGMENTIRALAEEPALAVTDQAPAGHPQQLERAEEALGIVVRTHRQRLALG